MSKKRYKSGSRKGLQGVTLCISTALVLVLLGLVVFCVLAGRNLSSDVKENLVVTVMFNQDMTDAEARQVCASLQKRPYIKQIQFVSKEQALQTATRDLGTDPSEFTDGVNFFSGMADLTLRSEYANNDSLQWISRELRKYPKVSEVDYQKDLVDAVNKNLAKIGLVLLGLAALLTFVSFSLINNTVRLDIYARRFSIHTMKLVGASWWFIRWPFIRNAMLIGLLSALLAVAALGGCWYALLQAEPKITGVVTWETLAVTAGSVFLFGILITALCAAISVTSFLKMKAGELYKI